MKQIPSREKHKKSSLHELSQKTPGVRSRVQADGREDEKRVKFEGGRIRQ